MALTPSFHEEKSLFNFVVLQGDGVKGMVDLGLSDVSEKYVQPSKERILKLDGVNNTITTPIDLSKLDGPELDKVAEEIGRAAEELEFFQVVNHGVPLERLEELKMAANNFVGLPNCNQAQYQVKPKTKGNNILMK